MFVVRIVLVESKLRYGTREVVLEICDDEELFLLCLGRYCTSTRVRTVGGHRDGWRCQDKFLSLP